MKGTKVVYYGRFLYSAQSAEWSPCSWQQTSKSGQQSEIWRKIEFDKPPNLYLSLYFWRKIE